MRDATAQVCLDRKQCKRDAKMTFAIHLFVVSKQGCMRGLTVDRAEQQRVMHESSHWKRCFFLCVAAKRGESRKNDFMLSLHRYAVPLAYVQ
eukprot:scaffold242474_cov18-Tisochrysis_lutea.AAC.4